LITDAWKQCNRLAIRKSLKGKNVIANNRATAQQNDESRAKGNRRGAIRTSFEALRSGVRSEERHKSGGRNLLLGIAQPQFEKDGVMIGSFNGR